MYVLAAYRFAKGESRELKPGGQYKSVDEGCAHNLAWALLAAYAGVCQGSLQCLVGDTLAASCPRGRACPGHSAAEGRAGQRLA